MRYPKPDSEPKASTTQLHGISVEPVAATDAALPKSRQRTIPVFRPPGAIAEETFLAGCTRCSDCIDACPHDAIRKAPDRLAAIAGTPVLEADTAACMMCDDFPCIAACKPGVLTQSIPAVMGTALVTEHLCLAHHSTTCTVCSERCPVQGAIRVMDGKPTICEDVCTGCGVCRYVCPAPENAILLMPAFSRPPLPDGHTA
ncbi:4Fe-4S dicluster domain-containing protein [Novipirellula artificiosorum]|uniref:Quinol dehydrogenase periplasmic component n=1 Tax=Novipirellula artificiosorum TaxID=2528016 RepID=A0A5C6DP14_9BACT|nr:4Fe-4S dicluster domain-containing protein [Novipirellula artificiosorum]TWU37391.1 quinol dehydrogenase periplasmic component [Novipirellula artificiosorum]